MIRWPSSRVRAINSASSTVMTPALNGPRDDRLGVGRRHGRTRRPVRRPHRIPCRSTPYPQRASRAPIHLPAQPCGEALARRVDLGDRLEQRDDHLRADFRWIHSRGPPQSPRNTLEARHQQPSEADRPEIVAGLRTRRHQAEGAVLGRIAELTVQEKPAELVQRHGTLGSGRRRPSAPSIASSAGARVADRKLARCRREASATGSVRSSSSSWWVRRAMPPGRLDSG